VTAPWHARRLGTVARSSLAALAVVALGGWEPFRTTDPDVEAGNQAYAEGRFDDALAAYDRAGRRGGVDPDGLAFDRGTAELKKSEAIADPAEKRQLAERALEDLKQAARGKDPHIRGAAHYNRGNALMSQDRLEDAIEAYKQALREDPDLDDARLNLELALRRRQKQQRKQQQQPQQGQGQQGQGQQRPGQGQNQQGQGSNGSNEQGSGEQGSGDQGSNQQNGSNGQGSNQNGSSGQGSNQQNGSNGQGSDQNGSNGAGSNQQNGSNGQGSNQQGSNQPGDQTGQNGQNPRGRSLRRSPQSPKTPIDGKLDDLDNYSRRLQKDEARRRATGKASDPKHDW
jgi:Ca-activated chloride channel homolog